MKLEKLQGFLEISGWAATLCHSILRSWWGCVPGNVATCSRGCTSYNQEGSTVMSFLLHFIKDSIEQYLLRSFQFYKARPLSNRFSWNQNTSIFVAIFVFGPDAISDVYTCVCVCVYMCVHTHTTAFSPLCSQTWALASIALLCILMSCTWVSTHWWSSPLDSQALSVWIMVESTALAELCNRRIIGRKSLNQ